jgi:hypothetical protein
MVVPDLRNDRHHRGGGAKTACGTISEKEKTFFLQKVFKVMVTGRLKAVAADSCCSLPHT